MVRSARGLRLSAETKETTRSIGWAFLDSGGQTLLSILFVLCITRFLTPDELGVNTLALTFVTMLGGILDALFSDAIARGRGVSTQHIDAAFTVSLLLGLGFCGLCWAAAPMLAGFFGDRRLEGIISVSSLSLPIAGITSVIAAQMRRNLQFKHLALRSSIGRVFGMSAGIVAAFLGCGVWSIVIQQIIAALAALAVTCRLTPRWPRIDFSFWSLRHLMAFAASSVLMQIIWLTNLRIFLGFAGYSLGAAELGFIGLGLQVADTLNAPLVSTANNVSVPLFTRRLDDLAAFRVLMAQAMQWTCIAGFFVLTGVICLVDLIVGAGFGARWAGAVPLIQIFCALSMVRLMTLFWGNAMTANGRPHYSVVWFLCSLMATGIGGYLFVPLGLVAAALVWFGQFAVTVPVGALLVKRAIGIPIREQIAPVFPAAAAAVAMTAVIFGIRTVFPAESGLFAALILGGLGSVAYGLVVCLLVGGNLPVFGGCRVIGSL